MVGRYRYVTIFNKVNTYLPIHVPMQYTVADPIYFRLDPDPSENQNIKTGSRSGTYP